MSGVGTSATDIGTLALREVRERHDAFVEWFVRGTEKAVMASIDAALGPDFAQVSPSGATYGRPALIDMLRGARATREADFAIAIEDDRVLWSARDAALVAYVERQWIGGETTRRRSTALFTLDPDAPGGVLWRHVQETWTDPPSGVARARDD